MVLTRDMKRGRLTEITNEPKMELGDLEEETGLPSPSESGSDSEEDEISDEEPGAVSEASQRDSRFGDGPPSKKPRLTKGELYKPPTSDELHQLKETENLFQSSLFRMQISELLSEMMMKEKKQKQIQTYLDTLESALTTLPPGDQHQLCEQKWLSKKRIKLPLTDQPKHSKGKFQFLTPKHVKVLGSYALGTTLRPDVNADIALEMPKECFQAKDHLNQRYLRKRALYLSWVAFQLRRREDLVAELSFAYHHGNHMKPILVIKPAADHGKHFTVRVHAYPEETAFKCNRFHIDKNNIRTQWFYPDRQAVEGKPLEDKRGKEGVEDEGSQPPTPHYNSWVLQDLLLVPCADCARRALGDSQLLKEGLALLRVWLHQRHLDVGYGSFSSFILTMYVAYLLSRRKLNTLMSSYQVVRNTLHQLASADWTNQGISLASTSADLDIDPHRPVMDDFNRAFDVVFVDPSGYLNLCADMNKVTFDRVKHEAQLSVEHLEAPGSNGFQLLFMTPVPFTRKFDQAVHLSSLQSLKLSVDKLQLSDQCLDHCGNYVNVTVAHILQILNKAIGHRVHLMDIKLEAPKQWGITECAPPVDAAGRLTIGLLLNTDFSSTVLDKGPPADLPEAVEFREFWGDRSELRRFQDGSICEAVVWQAETMADKRKVIAYIIKHILNRHAGVTKDMLTFVGPQLDRLLKCPQGSRKRTGPYGTGEEQHSSAHRAYDELAGQLRSLRDLPLTINTIQALSPVSRYAQVFPPIPAHYKCAVKTVGNMQVPVADQPCPPWVPYIKVLCLLEPSGKWPEDREAVRHIKAAFHIKLGQLLQSQCGLTMAIYQDHVMVCKSGYVFRVHLGYLKEISLCKMVYTPEGMLKMVDTDESAALERDLVALPKLTSALHGMHQQHSGYSGAVRLAKRWMNAQLLSAHYVAEEALELVVASLFLHPAPYSTPSTPLVGFMRFLNLLCTHDWQTTPLIVNLNGELSREDYTEIHNHFTKERSTQPLMCVATPYDKLGSMWTRRKPSAPILQRLALLARESLGVLQQQLEDTRTDQDFKQVFRAPLEVYDVSLHLHPEQLARGYQAVDVSSGTAIPCHQVAAAEALSPLPVTAFDPVQEYLQQLRDSFDELALFFHDTYGGDLIGVLWKPAAFQPRGFTVSHVNCGMPDSSLGGKDVPMVPNVEAILNDFKVMGQGLVKVIETKTEKWTI